MTTKTSQVIDVDNRRTWSADLRDVVSEMAQATPWSSYTGDLQIPDEADNRVRAVLQGHRLRAYHATRVLDHEREMIRSSGLRVFSESLFEDKIDAAYANGAITAVDRDLLRQTHMYATGEAQSRGTRDGQVCLFLGRRTMINEIPGIWNLVVLWGGEGISFSERDK